MIKRPLQADKEAGLAVAARRRMMQSPTPLKRPHSANPATQRPGIPVHQKKPVGQRRCQSLSPSNHGSQKSLERLTFPQESVSAPQTTDAQKLAPHAHIQQGTKHRHPLFGRAGLRAATEYIPALSADVLPAARCLVENHFEEKECTLPQFVVIKMLRTLATKRREFIKLRKNLIVQQNNLLEQYAALKEMEARAGAHSDETLGEVRILSVTNWPAHDLLLLIRDDLVMSLNSEISGAFGPQVLQQLHDQLNPIPEEMLSVGAEIMARRFDLLNLLRGKSRVERGNHVTNLEWKTKNAEFDHETEQLHRLVTGTAENLKAKINYSLELARVPWLDREALMKKAERLQKENNIFHHKLEEIQKKESELNKDSVVQLSADGNAVNYQAVCEELSKERAAREALKEVVAAAESMLRVARARIATLERHFKDTKAELETSRRKHKDLEQLYRHRETSYDARSKKLLEVSKTGEVTIEALARQRDALELRVKELHEHAEAAERAALLRETDQRSRVESLQAKVAEQEKKKEAAEGKVVELEIRVKELEETLHHLRERSGRLVDMERRRCLEYVPSKETEPSDRETEIWKELQVTRVSLSRAEEELRLSRADKESFLNSLSRIAQDGVENLQDKMSAELLEREQKIMKLQHIIEEQRENEKLMEQSMTQYENQMAALRLEVKRLRNYDCFSKEVPYQELQTELLELHMQVETLTQERAALVTAAASRALMLERHERAADLFARVTRARRDLAALIDGPTSPPPMDDIGQAEVSRSLTSLCATSADTWTALRAERARVLRLESAVLAQSLQLEREGRVRTQLERRRAILEREVIRAHSSASAEPSRNTMKNPSVIQDIFCYR